APASRWASGRASITLSLSRSERARGRTVRFVPSVRMSTTKTAFLGLGSMGLPLARHLLQAGHTATVYNRTRARADLLKQLYPVIGESPAAAARGAEVLITMVADDAALEAVLLGDQGALPALPRAAIHVSIST